MSESASTVLARFKSETGETVTNMMDLPRDVTVNHLQLICNSILKQVISLLQLLLLGSTGPSRNVYLSAVLLDGVFNFFFFLQRNNIVKYCFVKFQDETVPYAFFVDDKEITGNLDECLDIKKLNTEHVVEIVYQEQAVFKVRPITRCTRLVNRVQITYLYCAYLSHRIFLVHCLVMQKLSYLFNSVRIVGNQPAGLVIQRLDFGILTCKHRYIHAKVNIF